ncbi:DTW domain-containing protein 1 [Apophysomyces sp. BC1034]|nr:DTW domain-containing protein 1 [Apophysomyces sp. BC1015]KAG0179448.1 DTW domain-containing protein 1 [Apophysomyces sp. BC1021]KAG0185809.1 DTW domain-containing protein 1 [Apophysomyces sp. BC1034]
MSDQADRAALAPKQPFGDIKTSNDNILQEATVRCPCPQCGKTVKFFCYKCYQVVGMSQSDVPRLRLPVHLDVIKHEQEVDGKSTAIHARIIAPEDVDILTWSSMSSYKQNNDDESSRTLLLFPGPDAKTLDEIPRESFDRVVVIDGTWKQAKKIVRETPGLHRMRKVTMEPRQTNFWRFQQLSENYLATIEAIYYLYREYATSYETKEYDHRYDDLMYFYCFFYKLIQDNYRQHKEKKFTSRHKANYIQYDSEENK